MSSTTHFRHLHRDDTPDTLRGLHQSYVDDCEQEWFGWPHPPYFSSAERLVRYREVNEELAQLIDMARAQHKRLRARGSGWSSSEVANVRDWRLKTTYMHGLQLPGRGGSLTDRLTRSDVRRVRADRLLFVESGKPIRQLNDLLDGRGLSLLTSGSNDGQTLAGVLATGTHGSSWAVGATTEFVRGLHLVAGPGRNLFLQPRYQRVVKASFAADLGAELVEDDDMFQAALVGLGAFGIVRGVLIEARPRFTLHATRFWHPYDERVRDAVASQDAVSRLDFSRARNEDFQFPESIVDDPTKPLHHFQLYLDMNDTDDDGRPREAAVLAMFEDEYEEDYEPPIIPDRPGPGAAAIEIVNWLLSLPMDALTAPLVSRGIRKFLYEYYFRATIKDLFRGPRPPGPNLLSGTAVDRAQALQALEIVYDEYRRTSGVIPLVVAVRFVPRSRALLGFTRFAQTCVIDLDAPSGDASRDLVRRFWARLEREGIPFAVHWGKLERDLRTVLEGDGSPTPVQRMYGADTVRRWQEARTRVFGGDATLMRVFDNEFLERAGLT